MTGLHDKVQNNLKLKYFSKLKEVGFQNVGALEITSDTLRDIFWHDGVGLSEADAKASKEIKSAQAEVYMETHSLAPRKWRSFVAKKSKEF